MYSVNNIRRIRLVQPFNKDDRKIDDKLPNLPTLTSFKEFAYLFPNNENFEIRRVVPWNETRFTETEIARILGDDFTTISKDGYVICAIENAAHKKGYTFNNDISWITGEILVGPILLVPDNMFPESYTNKSKSSY